MRHSLLVCFVLILASACWCGTVLSAQENSALGCGTHSILRNTVASALTPLAREASQDIDEKSATSTIYRSESTADTFEPIRIGLFFDSLYDDSRYCANATANVTYYGSVRVPCSKLTILTDERRSTLMNTVMPRAVELLSERVLVRRYKKAIQVPRYESTRYCGQVTIPEEHHTNGVSGYDVIFYVSAKPNDPGVAAWAIGCTDNDAGDGRTIVALVNFGADAIETEDDSAIHAAVHEMLHGLGFSDTMFHKLNKLETTSVRGKADSLVLTTGPMLKATMAEHFGCASRAFIEMADDDGSHWKQRIMNEDIMGGFTTTGYISAITLAALEDTGMYQGVYEKAYVSPWGRGAGCAFLDEPCLTNRVALPGTQFCADEEQILRCDPERSAVAVCQNEMLSPVPSWASNYGQWTSNSGMDYCPVYGNGALGYGCVPSGDYVPDSVSGASSRCLDANRQDTFSIPTEAVCADVQCGVASYMVKFKNASSWVNCPAGTTVTTTSDDGTSRQVTCPPMHEVCMVQLDRTFEHQSSRSSGRIKMNLSLFAIALTLCIVL